jgi:DNA-binding phage protein
LGQTAGVEAEETNRSVPVMRHIFCIIHLFSISIRVAQLVEKAKLNRESLYKILSERGNPELKNLDALLHALRFSLAVMANR